MSDPVTLTLSREEALVLFDLLSVSLKADPPLRLDDPAAQRVLWDLECMLEAVLDEPLRADYPATLARARAIVAGSEASVPSSREP